MCGGLTATLHDKGDDEEYISHVYEQLGSKARYGYYEQRGECADTGTDANVQHIVPASSVYGQIS